MAPTTSDAPTIPPIPEPPARAGALVLDCGPDFRILFDLVGQMPSERQMFGMRRHIERVLERRWIEYSVEPGTLAWRWVIEEGAS